MIHNLFWQKWQGHGPFENLVKEMAIDSVVPAALQPRGPADCTGTHQTPLVRAWILEGEGKARGPRQSGESERTAASSMQGG